MDPALRERVRTRAGQCCEYCRLHQGHAPFVGFHVEHIIPRQHGGSDDPSNLALACHHCNLHKGPNLTGIDPESGQIVPLFNPRHAAWEAHFALQGAHIVGLTPTGRATVRVLAMNALERVQFRTELRASGEW
ncbi:MAG: HNH endonuclease [Gammaproteobacteria bacterium]